MAYPNDYNAQQAIQAKEMAGRARHFAEGPGLGPIEHIAAEIRTEPEISRLCSELDAAIKSTEDAASRLGLRIQCVIRPQPPQVNEAIQKQRGTNTQLGELLQMFIDQSRATCNKLNSLADSVEL